MDFGIWFLHSAYIWPEAPEGGKQNMRKRSWRCRTGAVSAVTRLLPAAGLVLRGGTLGDWRWDSEVGGMASSQCQATVAASVLPSRKAIRLMRFFGAKEWSDRRRELFGIVRHHGMASRTDGAQGAVAQHVHRAFRGCAVQHRRCDAADQQDRARDRFQGILQQVALCRFSPRVGKRRIALETKCPIVLQAQRFAGVESQTAGRGQWPAF